MKENPNIRFDKAVNLAREKSRPNKLITYYHNGEYITLGTVEFCAKFNIKYSDLSNALKNNELEDAIIKLTHGFYINQFGKIVYGKQCN